MRYRLTVNGSKNELAFDEIRAKGDGKAKVT